MRERTFPQLPVVLTHTKTFTEFLGKSSRFQYERDFIPHYLSHESRTFCVELLIFFSSERGSTKGEKKLRPVNIKKGKNDKKQNNNDVIHVFELITSQQFQSTISYNKMILFKI